MIHIEKIRFLFKTYLTLGLKTSIVSVFILSFLLTILMFIIKTTGWGDVVHDFRNSNYMNLLLNYIPILFSMLLLFFMSNSLTLATGIVSFVVIVASLINRFKIILRDDPFFPWDLALGSELVGIAGSFGTRNIILAISFVIVFIIGIVLFYFWVRTEKMKPIYRGITSVVCAAIMFHLNATVYRDTALINSLHVTGNVFNQVNTFNSRGFVYSFIYTHNVHRISMPDDFNIAPINEQINNFTPKIINDDIVTPHIIMIMSEAFSEMGLHPEVSFEGFEYHPQYYWKQIIGRAETIHGQIIVPNLGGGTADTEFDVLTGLNTRNLRGAPFSHRLVTNYFESIPSLLDQLGYRSIALHPGFRWFYNRQNVFRFFGFEHLYDIEYFEYYHFKGMYISEWATMDKLIDIFDSHLEDYPDTPFFNFTVTIQNHGPYTDKYLVDTNFSTTLDLTPEEMNPVSNYFHGLRDKDTELQRLIEHFEATDEPVVLVYFSDHLPAFTPSIYAQFYPDIFEPNSLGSTVRLHTVPFMIWQNEAARAITPLEENFETIIMPENMTISSSFLGAYVMQLLGFENLSPFFDYVNYIRTRFPIILESMSVGMDGKYSINMTEEERDPLILYRHWQFHKIFNQ